MVGVMLTSAVAGQYVRIQGARQGLLPAATEIPQFYKIALVAIAAGQPVIRGGTVIGAAISDIEAGELVHIHNLASLRFRSPDSN